jgi:DNA-binding HxlR family transcriptional regulator
MATQGDGNPIVEPEQKLMHVSAGTYACMTIRKEMSEQYIMKGSDTKYVRSAAFTVDVLFQGKWKVQILCALRSGPVRLGQLGRLIPGTSKKMLTQHLRQLEADGIVSRKDMSDLMLHVEYQLNDDMRHEICELLDHVAKWGALQLGK